MLLEGVLHSSAPAGGAYLLPGRPGLRSVVQHRRVPVVPGEHFPGRHHLEVVGRGQRLVLCHRPMAEVVPVELTTLAQFADPAGAQFTLGQLFVALPGGGDARHG